MLFIASLTVLELKTDPGEMFGIQGDDGIEEVAFRQTGICIFVQDRFRRRSICPGDSATARPA